MPNRRGQVFIKQVKFFFFLLIGGLGGKNMLRNQYKESQAIGCFQNKRFTNLNTMFEHYTYIIIMMRSVDQLVGLLCILLKIYN